MTPAFPPAASSPPSWLPRRGPGRRAGRPVAQPTFAGWRAGPPPPARRSRLLSAAPDGWSAGSRAGVLLAALGCPSAPPRCPLPSCAQLTGARGLQVGQAGGASLRIALEQVERAAIYQRLALAGAFGPPQPAALFCASSGRSVAVWHRFSAVCRAYRCSGSTRRGRIRAGVRGWGGEALVRSNSSRGGQQSARAQEHGMAGHMAWPALVTAALNGLRGRKWAGVGSAPASWCRRIDH